MSNTISYVNPDIIKNFEDIWWIKAESVKHLTMEFHGSTGRKKGHRFQNRQKNSRYNLLKKISKLQEKENINEFI